VSTSKAVDTSTAANRVALDAQLSRLRRWEKTDRVYREMLAAADQRMAGVARAAQAKRDADQ